MKRTARYLCTLTVLLGFTGPALAHGVHAPVSDHGTAHFGAGLGLAALALAALIAWRQARRHSDEVRE